MSGQTKTSAGGLLVLLTAVVVVYWAASHMVWPSPEMRRPDPLPTGPDGQYQPLDILVTWTHGEQVAIDITIDGNGFACPLTTQSPYHCRREVWAGQAEVHAYAITHDVTGLGCLISVGGHPIHQDGHKHWSDNVRCSVNAPSIPTGGK